MAMENAAPATWAAADVVVWATQAKLAPDIISSLTLNQVDGPTLVTLTKSELLSELGIVSLPKRRYLWELIKSLKSEQETSDYSVAIEVHEEEIRSFSFSPDSDTVVLGPDAGSGGGAVMDNVSSLAAVVNELVTDVQSQRQVIGDRMMAYRLQKTLNNGQEICRDAELAHEEQGRLDQLRIQAERDREYAENLAVGRERNVINRRRRQETQLLISEGSDTESQADNRIASLFGMCVQTCSDNKVNVAEAFQTGKVKPIVHPAVVSDDESSDNDDIDRKPAAANRNVFNLPFIEQCNVCYETEVKGYSLACDHLHCVQCMGKLFRAALRDNILLPLRCCEIPIDMNIAYDLLNQDHANLILKRVEEKEARNKMYCPSCSSFVNLDLIDTTDGNEFLCSCDTFVCIVCKTGAHPGITCRQNQGVQSGSDDMVLELSREQGWKQCPKCSVLIELRSGCNHMTCTNCSHEFCYRCLQEWNTRRAQCSSGACELWDEDRLVEAGEARVQQEEAAHGMRLAEPVRRERLHNAMAGLRLNEVCVHQWVRHQGYHGDCANCSFTMWAYGMRCRSDCESTVCYTCAHHRIPNRGWR
jgi:hypothetical protein